MYWSITVVVMAVIYLLWPDPEDPLRPETLIAIGAWEEGRRQELERLRRLGEMGGPHLFAATPDVWVGLTEDYRPAGVLVEVKRGGRLREVK